MAKTKNDHHRIFVMVDPHLTKDGKGYVNIRVANRQNRNRTVDVAVYLPSGERFKLRPGQLVDEHYDNGTDEQQRNFINAHLDELKNKINRYSFNRELVTKKELENVLYGVDFLNEHKKARTKTIEIKITDTVPNDLHAFLRKDYPKKIQIQKIKTVNDEGFEVIEEKKVVLDPLSLEDFPNNLHPELYQQVKDEVLQNASPEQRKRYESKAGKWFLNQRILFQIHLKYPLMNYPVKEVVKVSNDVIKEYERRHGKLKVSEKGFLAPDDNRILLEIREQIELKNLSTEQIYKRGLFNKNDIFQIFALTYILIYRNPYVKSGLVNI